MWKPKTTLIDDHKHLIDTLVKSHFNSNNFPRSKFLCISENQQDAAKRALEFCSWDLKSACNLIELNLEWREREGIDTILLRGQNEHTLAIRRAMRDGFYGSDHQSYPVYWIQAGKVDLSKFQVSDLVQHHVQIMEYNQQVYFPLHYPNKHSVISVMDLKGFGTTQLGCSIFRQCMSSISYIDEHYYYGSIHRVLILNAPFAFRMFWKTTSVFWRKETKERFVFLSDYLQLEDFISKQYIPKSFGGLTTGAIFSEEDQQETVHSRAMDEYIN